jgi:mannitol 2-dehydrogenase
MTTTNLETNSKKQKILPSLCNATLSSLGGGGDTKHPPVELPTYDRHEVSPGILHIGVGNFHRAHLAHFMDDLLKMDFERHKQWGIVGASLFSAKKRQILASQDWLQTLVERDGTSEKASILGCMVDYLPVQEKKELQKTLTDPNIKIVSLTVTEGGYFLSDGKFDPSFEQIQQDIATPTTPTTIFGMMIHALQKRHEAGLSPFTVLCCDNIPQNGNVVRSLMVELAALMYPQSDLSNWIDTHVAFPSSMVDRITPETTPEQIEHVQTTYGYQDARPIFCEPFRQWVIEDVPFSSGRPAWEKLSGDIMFVPNVEPYEEMKIRILNGGHASLCYPAALLGVDYVHEAMEHPTIGPFLDALERTEIIPTVPPVPDTNLEGYWKVIATRFSNPTIGDTISRICYDGASRQPKFIVPVAADGLQAGTKIDGLALVSVLWCRYCQGMTESGETIEANDPQWDRLQHLALASKTDPTKWLSMTDVYGQVGQDPVFQAAFREALQTMEKDGVEAALKQYIAAAAIQA